MVAAQAGQGHGPSLVGTQLGVHVVLDQAAQRRAINVVCAGSAGHSRLHGAGHGAEDARLAFADGKVHATGSDRTGTLPEDSIDHDFAVLDPDPAPKSEFITVHDGDSWLKGKRRYPVDINYWPLYVAGMDPGDYWAGWLRDRYYKTNLVEQDLVQMADMGINMVSTQSPPVGGRSPVLLRERLVCRLAIPQNAGGMTDPSSRSELLRPLPHTSSAG